MEVQILWLKNTLQTDGNGGSKPYEHIKNRQGKGVTDSSKIEDTRIVIDQCQIFIPCSCTILRIWLCYVHLSVDMIEQFDLARHSSNKLGVFHFLAKITKHKWHS
uniref:Uncharacterized protein n=1 Tax=Salix viminalis TaxID=40686 RepID=A0A6N2LNJ8_SALVM